MFRILNNNEWITVNYEDIPDSYNGNKYRKYLTDSLDSGFAEMTYSSDREPIERLWRDMELLKTDENMKVSDYPNIDTLPAYRQALRDYPAQADFPNGARPEW